MVALIEARINETNPKIRHLFISHASAIPFRSLSEQLECVYYTVTMAPFRASWALSLMMGSIATAT